MERRTPRPPGQGTQQNRNAGRGVPIRENPDEGTRAPLRYFGLTNSSDSS
jgi:hypothetical protein